MTELEVGFIVEGHGDIKAVPALFRRVAGIECPGLLVITREVIRVSRDTIGVALAHHEFESWFLAGAESLAGFRDLQADLKCPTEPEKVRGAKEWLSQRMTRPYRETTDQELLAKRIDLTLARRARSFDKFYRESARLCGEALRA